MLRTTIGNPVSLSIETGVDLETGNRAREYLKELNMYMRMKDEITLERIPNKGDTIVLPQILDSDLDFYDGDFDTIQNYSYKCSVNSVSTTLQIDFDIIQYDIYLYVEKEDRK